MRAVGRRTPFDAAKYAGGTNRPAQAQITIFRIEGPQEPALLAKDHSRAYGGVACIRAGLQLDRRNALPLGGRGIVERAAGFSLHDYCVLMNFSTTPLSSAT